MRSMFLILNQKIEGIKKIRVDNVLAITYNSIRREFYMPKVYDELKSISNNFEINKKEIFY